MLVRLCMEETRWLFVKRHTTIRTKSHSTVSVSFDYHDGYQAVSTSQLMITLLGRQASVLTQPCSIMQLGNSDSLHGVHFYSSGYSGFLSLGLREGRMDLFMEYSIGLGRVGLTASTHK